MNILTILLSLNFICSLMNLYLILKNRIGDNK